MEIRLENCRLAFAQLFEPKQVNGEGEPAYSGSFIFPKDSANVKRLNAAIEQVAKEKWAEKAPVLLKQLRAADKICLRDGDLKPDYDGFPGNFYVSARTKSRPLLINQKKEPLAQTDGKPYSGCFVTVLIDVWAQDNNFGKRINASLKGVQFAKDGDAFSGAAPASPEAFEDLSEGAEDEAALA